uniref:Uncharacterized protein n=2 Tax=viral metagenome TaxID=1070528 RepID=A0A6M3M0H6_9ZZZZ
MGIADRIEGTIENWRTKFGEALKSFLIEFLSLGFDAFFNVLGKAFAPLLKPLVNLAKTTDMPDELKPLLEEIENPKGEVAAMLGASAAGAGTGGLISSTLGPILLKYCQYNIQAKIRQYLPPEAQLIVAMWRGELTRSEVDEILKKLGYEDEWIDKVEKIYKFLPSASDIVSWYAREVYEPDMISRYGLDSELPAYEGTDFSKIGVDAKQAKNYWMAHWIHASYMQIREMIHRGVLTKDKTMPAPPTTEAGWIARDAEGTEAAFDWYRLVEIPPFWRDRLTEMMFEVPTRVDVRRWWDMRTIDEERLRSIYHSQGYHGKDLDDYILWTKVYVAFPDLVARWKNGWITEEEVRSELATLGMPPDRVEEMIQTKIKPVGPERVEGEKNLTKAEIYAGVKKGVISWDDGLELLQDLGYDADEAEFILRVRVGALEGSPDTFMEFKEWTQKYKQAMGLKANIPPAELLEAGKALREAEAALKEAEEKKGKGKADTALYKAVSDATYRYKQLLAKFKET